jgi:hypothetical protein
MQLLFQRSLRSGTRVLSPAKISAEAVLLSSDREMVARLVAAADTFIIEHAEWESLRIGADYRSQFSKVPELLGTVAYFGASPALLRAFPGPGQEVQRELMAECVKAVLQSETYLFHNRGFADSQAYQDNWDQVHPNTCRYYSHLDLVGQRWFDHIGSEIRKRDLFQRHKNIAVWQSAANTLKATGSFLDSFHELGVVAECDTKGQIIAFEGSFLRAPDRICFGTAELLGRLVGQNIRSLTHRDMNRCAGGGEGCAHLLDISREALRELQNALKSIDEAQV